ncbi:hypothetical protein GGTG_04921 [Gaeumannomyces tritici R3-111a-1]|uniref:Uncharacterized protein n=1 Tax=Gaeumannomyces tritici (strain R3-111a-1) TaxID=644352 RepID=J3NUG5_GAET3|nr:hypothetical protein GGTG_04921 [Gaeumannomyces tritici R3-111a-1]EJT79838.1 hypothetical protein GGTG_04921 [Gaeumannomyces tritici R3-111a-1]
MMWVCGCLSLSLCLCVCLVACGPCSQHFQKPPDSTTPAARDALTPFPPLDPSGSLAQNRPNAGPAARLRHPFRGRGGWREDPECGGVAWEHRKRELYFARSPPCCSLLRGRMILGTEMMGVRLGQHKAPGPTRGVVRRESWIIMPEISAPSLLLRKRKKEKEKKPPFPPSPHSSWNRPPPPPSSAVRLSTSRSSTACEHSSIIQGASLQAATSKGGKSRKTAPTADGGTKVR